MESTNKGTEAVNISERREPLTSQYDHAVPMRFRPSKGLWEDVTDLFRRARKEMEVGELIHPLSFSLHAAMSAIELMDPKMDIGYGETRDVSEVVLPDGLSDAQVINIMDQLLACLMSWLDGHTLPQTVFACVYAQRLYQIPRPELSSYLHVLLAIMDSVINLVLDERVADEEDFMASTYGFNLQPLTSDPPEEDGLILRKILNAMNERPKGSKDDEKASADAIALRVRFVVEFYRLMQCLSGFSSEHSLSDAGRLLSGLKGMAGDWISSSHGYPVDVALIDRIFDSSINRHLMTSSPPRTAPLFDFDGASLYLRRILNELTEAVALEELALPSLLRKDGTRYPLSQRHSLHVAIHSVSCYSARLNPTILTRSVLSRIMLPEYSSALFARDGAQMRRLFATDMGVVKQGSDDDSMAALEGVEEGILSTFKCLCRNPSRQRRLLLRISRWWDHFASLASPSQIRSESPEDSAKQDEHNTTTPNSAEGHECIDEADTQRLHGTEDSSAVDNLFSDMSLLQVVAYEVTARLMIQHWLLGFECDLYQTYEYPAVFFYVAYALAGLANATTSLARKNHERLSLHPLRFALYRMDEARLWMCRAFHSALMAFSRGKRWDYSHFRQGEAAQTKQEMFGSEELWYEQRFGVTMGLVNGPAHAGYASFVSFQNVQEESLLEKGEGTDIVVLFLKDAAKGFLVARRMLETAKKSAEICSPNNVRDEVLQIARVAVENSLTLSQVLRSYNQPQAQTKSPDTKHHVSFSFAVHRHFPVVKITP